MSIVLRDVCHVIGDGPRVLDGVSLRIDDGEFVAVMGANGSGKSTLAKHLNALLTPTSGEVLIAGMDTRVADNVFPIRERVGMVFQNPDHQIVATVVDEEVAFGPENLCLPPGEIRRRVDEALATVNMTAHRGHSPAHLSGGQKQRVAIASILAMAPRVMVLDEPTAMLDASGRAEVMGTLRALHRERGMTVVLVTHSVEEALEASRVIVLDKGRVARDAAPGIALADAVARGERFLAVPPLVCCLMRLQSAGIAVPTPFVRTPQEAATMLSAIAAPAAEVARAEASAVALATGADVLRLEDVSFTYMEGTPLRQPVLHGISLRVARGERVALLGRTGSGKTTLLQHFNGLLQPTAGRVFVEGRIGMLFQMAEQQLFEETVRRDVAFGPRALGWPSDEVERVTTDALARVSLGAPEMAERSPFTLSGGEQRRVALAGVLACKPAVLVLDEPTVGLDGEGRAALLEVLEGMRGDAEQTLIFTSHDIDIVAALADRVVVLEEGRIVADGPARDVLTDPPAGLQPPAVAALAGRLRDAGWPLSRRVLDPETLAQEVLAAARNRGEE